MKKYILLLMSGFLIYNVDAQTSFSGCPNTNLAIVRQGTNSDNTNPVSIYNITSSGVLSAPTAPILDPNNHILNLQINGVGLNSNDGFLYGLSSATPTNTPSFTPSLPFYRLGSDAIAAQVGVIPPPSISSFPTPPLGSVYVSFANPAAGECDAMNNYYFTGATGILNLAGTASVNKLYLGKLGSLNTLSNGSTASLSPAYTPITSTDPNCTGYLSSLLSVFPASQISAALTNTGLDDFAYDKANNMLYSYVVYTAGSSTFGLMIKLDPLTGILTSVNNTAPGPSPFVDASVGVAGTLLDANGNFLIMFTNGQIYRANTSSPGVFTGSISQLNANTILPTVLRGDLASCGAASLLPISLDYFNAYNQNNTAILKWETSAEINASSFIVEKSSNAASWTVAQTIAATGSASTTAQYQFIDKDITGAAAYYYRLKLVDLDGSFKYSVVKKVSFGVSAGNTLACYPNPASSTIYVESNTAFSGDVKVQLSNMLGKTISPVFKKADNKLTLDISSLSSGVYFLQVSEGNNVRTQKIVKQ